MPELTDCACAIWSTVILYSPTAALASSLVMESNEVVGIDTDFALKVSELAKAAAAVSKVEKELRKSPKSDICASSAVCLVVKRSCCGALLTSTSLLTKEAESIPEPEPKVLIIDEPVAAVEVVEVEVVLDVVVTWIPS